MSPVASVDGLKLHCEERGAGPAVLFVHEYGGSCRSFDMQVEAFRARYRCVVFNARGYPPSEVPASVGSYSQEHALADIGSVLDGLAIGRAHLVGVSMGAASALQFALKQPGRVLSATLVGIGSGSDDPALFRENAEANAKQIETGGMRAFAEQTSRNANRIRLKDKNPAEFRRSLEEVSRARAARRAPRRHAADRARGEPGGTGRIQPAVPRVHRRSTGRAHVAWEASPAAGFAARLGNYFGSGPTNLWQWTGGWDNLPSTCHGSPLTGGALCV